MPSREIRTTLTLAEILDRLQSVPAAVSGADATATRNVLEPVGGKILELVCDRFDAMAVPGGTYSVTGESWPDNAPATVAAKQGHAQTPTGKRLVGLSYQNYAIGVDDGTLRQSLEPDRVSGVTGLPVPSHHPDQVFQITGGNLEVGTAVDWAESFATGGGGAYEPRPLLPEEFPAAWEQEIADTAAEAVAGVIVERLLR